MTKVIDFRVTVEDDAEPARFVVEIDGFHRVCGRVETVNGGPLAIVESETADDELIQQLVEFALHV